LGIFQRIFKMNNLISIKNVITKIYQIKESKVLIDKDLAILYGVETKVLKQAVRRNIERFPSDFMFELTKNEEESLRSQSVTLKGRGQHSKYLSFAFTEQGVAMLSSVLKSKEAIKVNISIMRAFVEMRKMISTHKELKKKIETMESKYDNQFKIVFDTIRQLLVEEEKTKRKIGF
jgi:hypothetical protein